jgi:hypothetical protein
LKEDFLLLEADAYLDAGNRTRVQFLYQKAIAKNPGYHLCPEVKPAKSKKRL